MWLGLKVGLIAGVLGKIFTGGTIICIMDMGMAWDGEMANASTF